MNANRIAAIVLAAGFSSRMGPRNKLLEPVRGAPMVRRVAATAVASGADPVLVVTGHDAAAVKAVLQGLDVTLIFNPNYADGLSASLHAGVTALPTRIEGALILLGDMPEVDVPVAQALVAAFTGTSAICVPVHHGRRGNPVLWGRRYFTEMMELTGDGGAKPLMARHCADLIEVEIANESIFHDVDAPEDLARLRGERAAG